MNCALAFCQHARGQEKAPPVWIPFRFERNVHALRHRETSTARSMSVARLSHDQGPLRKRSNPAGIRVSCRCPQTVEKRLAKIICARHWQANEVDVESRQLLDTNSFLDMLLPFQQGGLEYCFDLFPNAARGSVLRKRSIVKRSLARFRRPSTSGLGDHSDLGIS